MEQFDMHLYHCSECNVTFGVEDSEDVDHGEIVCTICITDENLLDVGSGSFTLTHLPETE
ncbi:hypothetical protein LSG31_00605 [Fodinisporobacter ferrooxydans]|uniref:Uncharacterized protein n=1 Tax=Fodinisporobacter ferrooxydans TaxID=2901836 RepID=A0ABY4CKG4_9BACL|nr:hypothetical protein LSG31_00605 [Alicyclobacillaceae bacterium MYW30-H2]